MKTKLEYIWLDGYKPEPNLRSKIKVCDLDSFSVDELPEWSFDGSSTKQAEGHFSDCILKPVRVYPNSLETNDLLPSFFVLCEVMNPDGTPHPTNTRSLIETEDTELWFGFEQEYTIVKDGRPLGFPLNGYPEPQGKYYCGVGNGQVNGREFVNKHMEACIKMGIDITGTNAEVLLGQWEYQVFSKGKMKAGDDLWMTRYILQRMSEDYGFNIEFHPKPVMGDWNGSGLHCNISNERMRTTGGEQYFKSIFNAFAFRHQVHIDNYGSDNNLRLTGKHETQSIDKFNWGISDRGSSIRVPLSTSKEWKGYIEDRRPASNGDPYKIVSVISITLDFAAELYNSRTNMNYNSYETSFVELVKKFGGVSTKELLMEYQSDDNFEFTNDVMESNANIKTEEIEFDLNHDRRK
jgi:glutamine synthetase